jgi:hypothetical protein
MAMALTAILAAPVTAVASDATAPVRVERCSVVAPAGVNKSGALRAWLGIRFMNLRDVPADVVTFRVGDDAQRTVIDRGIFRRDVSIDHEFATAIHQNPGTERRVQCSVTSVHFRDNTAWPPKEHP